MQALIDAIIGIGDAESLLSLDKDAGRSVAAAVTKLLGPNVSTLAVLFLVDDVMDRLSVYLR